jgi:hypothetical protein
MADIYKQREIFVLCDIHGHSKNLDVFLYGCYFRDEDTSYDLREKNQFIKLLPFLFGHRTNSFAFDRCSFGIQ